MLMDKLDFLYTYSKMKCHKNVEIEGLDYLT